MVKNKRLEIKDTKKDSSKRTKKEIKEQTGRRWILILLLVTTLLSLVLYLKQRLSRGMKFSLPQIGGAERIIFEK